MKRDMVVLFTGTKLIKRLAYLAVLAPLICLFQFSGATAQEDGQIEYTIGFLVKERSLAKSYASIHEEFGKDNTDNYVKGIRLYAVAKAEFDGLIEQLKWNLSHDTSLKRSPDFTNALNLAAQQRVAFTKFVDGEVRPAESGSKNPLAVAAIGTIPELIKALTEAGLSIWKEYRQGNKEQKKEILDRLDSTKWPDYSEIAGRG